MGIKAIVFDVGGVLIDEPGFAARDIIANKYGFNAKDFKDYAMRNLDKSHKGELKAEDFFTGLISELGLDVESSVLIDEWKSARDATSNVDIVVKETVDKLKGNYVLGVLSNNTCLNEEVEIRKSCYGSFDFKILSCEVGAVKPDKDIYEILLDRLKERGVNRDEAVFIDDRKENLVPAEELGLKTILFEDGEQMIRDLRKLEVDI